MNKWLHHALGGGAKANDVITSFTVHSFNRRAVLEELLLLGDRFNELQFYALNLLLYCGALWSENREGRKRCSYSCNASSSLLPFWYILLPFSALRNKLRARGNLTEIDLVPNISLFKDFFHVISNEFVTMIKSINHWVLSKLHWHNHGTTNRNNNRIYRVYCLDRCELPLTKIWTKGYTTGFMNIAIPYGSEADVIIQLQIVKRYYLNKAKIEFSLSWPRWYAIQPGRLRNIWLPLNHLMSLVVQPWTPVTGWPLVAVIEVQYGHSPR